MSDTESEYMGDYRDDALYKFCEQQATIDRKHQRELGEEQLELFTRVVTDHSRETLVLWESRGNLYGEQYRVELEDGLKTISQVVREYLEIPTETLADVYEEFRDYDDEATHGERYGTTNFGVSFGLQGTDGPEWDAKIGDDITAVRHYLRNLYAFLLSAEDHNRDYRPDRPYTHLMWSQVQIRRHSSRGGRRHPVKLAA
jgi:hypothetical protein